MEQMLKTRGDNYLLAKSELGRGRPATMTLPGPEHVYGYPNKYDKNAIKRLTTSWNLHHNSVEEIPKTDYMRINREG